MSNSDSYFPLLIRLSRTGEEKVVRDTFELPKGGFRILQTRYTGRISEHAN